MSSLLFIFGRTPELALPELQTFFPKARTVSEHVAIVESISAADRSLQIFQSLGGSIKIADVLLHTRVISPQLLASLIRNGQGKNIIFGLSSYDEAPDITNKFLREMKGHLESSFTHVRFVASHKGNALSSVVVKKQLVRELILAKEGAEYIVARTIGVQDFEQWNYRDYQRPFADPRSGMLPPKVARMIVNIASVSSLKAPQGQTPVLLDPFCGMGTILAEALLTGWAVIGSDESKDAVGKTAQNLSWLISTYRHIDTSAIRVLRSDATHISQQLAHESIDAIVTEPFMGSASRSGNNPIKQMSGNQINETKNIMKGLEKLYIGCLKDWYRVLKPGGKVVIALPEYAIDHRTFFVKNVVDKCENFGYTVVQGPIGYSRPQAVVRRKFFVFRKQE